MENQQIKNKYYARGPWKGYVRSSMQILSEEYGKSLDEIRAIIRNKPQVVLFEEIIPMTQDTLSIPMNKELITLPDNFAQLTNLSTINISHNRLSALPENFGQLKHLSTLTLNNNRLTGLPESFGQLSNLTYFNISDNGLISLPESFGNLSKLSVFWAQYNELTTLPASFPNLKRLEALQISVNNISVLPNNFGNLTALKIIRITGNSLTRLPDSIGKLVQLTEFYCNYNNLIEIPESIGKLTKLWYLNLGDNQLTNLPSSIAKLPNLTDLVLASARVMKLSPDLYTALSRFNLPRNVSRLLYAPKQIQESMRKELVKNYKAKAVKYVSELNDPEPGQTLEPVANVPNKLLRAYKYAEKLKTDNESNFDVIELSRFPSIEMFVTAEELNNGQFCFQRIVSERTNARIFQNKLQITILGTPALDLGGVSREFFSSVGIYIKTLMVEDEGFYKFKYETPMSVVRDIAVALTIAYFQNCALNIAFSSGILHLWVCGIARMNFARSFGSPYTGTLLYLLDRNKPGIPPNPEFLVPGAPSGSQELLTLLQENFLTDAQPLVESNSELQTKDILLFVFKRVAERSLFYGNDVWFTTQQGRNSRRNELVQDIYQSEKLYLLWDAFIKGVELCGVTLRVQQVDLQSLRKAMGVVLTEELMLPRSVDNPKGMVIEIPYRPQLLPKFLAYYTNFIQTTDEPVWNAFLKFTTGNAVPHNLQFTIYPENDARLPSAHTCSFTLDVPNYSTAEIFREKLLVAINETGGFSFT